MSTVVYVVVHRSDDLGAGEGLIGLYGSEERAEEACGRIKALRSDRFWDEEVGEVLEVREMELETPDGRAVELLDEHIEGWR